MKKIALIIGLFAFTSCDLLENTIIPTPVSNFTITEEAFGAVTVNILSDDFEDGYIDWGDGDESKFTKTSTTVNHTYSKDGNYKVTMEVYSKNAKKSDESSKTAMVNTTMGSTMIYLAKALRTGEAGVAFAINEEVLGYATKNNTFSGILSCTDAESISGYGIKKFLKPGVYNYEVVSLPNKTMRWSGSVTISNNNCKVIKLI